MTVDMATVRVKDPGQSGAVTLELALVFLPFLLIWILSLDFGLSLVELSNFRRAHYSAGRAIALKNIALQHDCIDQADTLLSNQLASMGLSRAFSSAGSGTVEVNGQKGFNYQVSIPTRCLSCAVMPGLPAISAYRSGTFFPYENQNACQ